MNINEFLTATFPTATVNQDRSWEKFTIYEAKIQPNRKNSDDCPEALTAFVNQAESLNLRVERIAWNSNGEIEITIKNF